jgi:uncharacterized protein YndB with AHSA1/START domain
MPQLLRQVYQLYIRTTPERLWQAITDPAITKLYFYESSVESTWKPGGPLNRRRADGSFMLEGEVLEIDPPHRLVHTFVASHRKPEDRDPPSRVTWEIEPRGETCRLTLTHEHYAGDTETYRGTVTGWNPVLSGLKTLLETGRTLEITFPDDDNQGEPVAKRR